MFEGDRELDIVQYAVTASAGYISASRWSVRGSIGSVIDGSLEGDGRTHDIGPGIVAAARTMAAAAGARMALEASALAGAWWIADARPMLHRAGCTLVAAILLLLPAPRTAEA